MNKILALIPARSGSKSVPDKNIRTFKGKPLIAHSIEQALNSKLINRTIVSTDSENYAEIARQYRAETPFLRPAEIAQDLSTDFEVFEHALTWLKDNENYIPDICVHLRPTYPVRRIEDIDAIIEILLKNPEIDSIRTVAPTPDTPFKMWFRNESGILSPVVKTDMRDAYNLPRQILPPVFLQNACIDAVRTRVIVEQKSMTGRTIYGYVMKENYDIDTESQLENLKTKFEDIKDDVITISGGKIFCFDVDGVIAEIVPGNQYDLSKPIAKNISLINAVYEKGHTVLLFTARGSATGIDWKDVTYKQMHEWGVKYHKILFGKPASDYYIDDKMISVAELERLLMDI